MTIIIGLLTALAMVALLVRIRGPRHQSAADAGAMSERWLAEHRASRNS